MAKKRRVPEILWRLFRDRATTLADAVVSLLHPPSSMIKCGCNGRGCLGCSGGDAMAFLVRSGDPPEFKRLMSQCFVVVSDHAPRCNHFRLDSHWSQHQIVVTTIDLIMCEQPKDVNVICHGYDKDTQSSHIVKMITCSAWEFLLRRVGDDIMTYLLKYTCIFLPLSLKKLQQVSGNPIILDIRCARQKKKRVDALNSNLERQQTSGSSNVHFPRFSSLQHDSENCLLTSVNRDIKIDKMCSSDATTQKTMIVVDATLNLELQITSNELIPKLRKRTREFSRQRKRKHSMLNYGDNSTTLAMDNDEDSSGRLPCELSAKSCSAKKCSHSSILQTCKIINKGSQINRQSMFSNLECSSSALPRKHTLHSLKPNSVDSEFLTKHIFCSSNAKVIAQNMSSLKSENIYTFESTRQFFILSRLLKILIHRTRCCRHVSLLDKHCATPSVDHEMLRSGSSLAVNLFFFTSFLGAFYAKLIKSASNKSFFYLQMEGNALEEMVPEKVQGKKYPESIEPEFAPIRFHCSRHQVVSFVWAVCRSLIPADLLGKPSNWRILIRNISKFIQLRRFEKFSLKQAMHKLKISGFPFLWSEHSLCRLDDKSDNFLLEKFSINVKKKRMDMNMHCCELNSATSVVKHRLLESWIFWLFSDLVVPLLEANFYVTEMDHGKGVHFYRKSIWEKLSNRAITSLKDQSYQCLNDASVRNILKSRLFGFSKLRLRPKENGVRLLANLKSSSRIPEDEFNKKDQYGGVHRRANNVKFKYYKPVNNVMRDVHAVLKGIQNNEPELLGSSLFDYNDIYRRLCPFVTSLKKQAEVMPQLFLVVSDVSTAFDSVIHDKLLGIMKNVIRDNEYCLKQSYEVFCTKNSFWIHNNIVWDDSKIRCIPMPSTHSGSLHSILISQERSKLVKKKELFFNLNEHVKRNVLQLDKKFYLQGMGIPQGSVISSLLCSFYYGDLERCVIYPFLERSYQPFTENSYNLHTGCNFSLAHNTNGEKITSSSGFMLLRFIDDFLLISTSKKQATKFLFRLQRGFRDYNCYMNEKKFGINFDVGHTSGILPNRMFVGKDGNSFLRWSGLLINCRTLEVQADYTKYLGSHLSVSLTVIWQGKPGQHLKRKLCDYITPKCHPIFFDSNINSATVVRLNIFQAFLLGAMKFHSHVCQLSYICKFPTKFHLNIIRRSFRYMKSLVKKRMLSIDLDHPHLQPSLHLEEGEIEWLGLNAFFQALKRKQTRHTQLVASLRSMLLVHKMADHISAQLSYAVDSSHSSLLWKIKY